MIKKQDRKFITFSLAPVLITMFGLLGYPILYCLYLSFTKYNITRPSSIGVFNGLENFKNAIMHPLFFKSIRVTLVYTVLAVILELIIGIFIALLLSKLGKVRNIVLALIIIPWAIPNVVNGLMWRWMFNPYYGFFNGLLYSLGFIKDYISLLNKPVMAMAAIVNAQIWRQLPFVIFFLFAGLQSIPEELSEAAKVDGASPFRIFFNITLPLLRPTILILLIIETMHSIRTFDTIWVITGGGPGTATYVLSWLTYNTSFREYDFGQGSALSLIILAITIIFASIYIKFYKSAYAN